MKSKIILLITAVAGLACGSVLGMKPKTDRENQKISLQNLQEALSKVKQQKFLIDRKRLESLLRELEEEDRRKPYGGREGRWHRGYMPSAHAWITKYSGWPQEETRPIGDILHDLLQFFKRLSAKEKMALRRPGGITALKYALNNESDDLAKAILMGLSADDRYAIIAGIESIVEKAKLKMLATLFEGLGSTHILDLLEGSQNLFYAIRNDLLIMQRDKDTDEFIPGSSHTKALLEPLLTALEKDPINARWGAGRLIKLLKQTKDNEEHWSIKGKPILGLAKEMKNKELVAYLEDVIKRAEKLATLSSLTPLKKELNPDVVFSYKE